MDWGKLASDENAIKLSVDRNGDNCELLLSNDVSGEEISGLIDEELYPTPEPINPNGNDTNETTDSELDYRIVIIPVAIIVVLIAIYATRKKP